MRADTFQVIKVIFFSWSVSVLCIFGLAAESFAQCERVVSLAPSVTETLYELGLGKQVVGVTKFDVYPADVKNKVIIGGFLDPNLELILKLKPSIAIGLSEHGPTLEKLEALHIKTTSVDHRSVESILESFHTLSEVCKVPSAGQKASSHIKQYLNEVKGSRHGRPSQKVAIVVSRNYDSPDLKEVYLSGIDGYYDTLLSYAGAQNVYQRQSGSVSAISIEGLYALNPDIIIEVLPPGFLQKYSYSQLSKPWQTLHLLRAVREGKLYFLDDDWATIPGPRMTLVLDRFIEIVSSGPVKQ